MSEERVVIDLDGKYQFIETNFGGKLVCLRYGEEWREFVGDKAVGRLFGYAVELRDQLRWRSCVDEPPEGKMGEYLLFCNEELHILQTWNWEGFDQEAKTRILSKFTKWRPVSLV